MFTATTFYRICIGVLGAVSVRGECWLPPDVNGLVVIPEGTETIPKYAFSKCDTLKKINIPASVENIELRAFFQAANLKRVFFQKGSRSRLESIGGSAFSDCQNLRKINFPTNLKKIGFQAFSYTGLKKINFKKGSRIRVIGARAFFNCKELKGLILPPSLKEIAISAFFFSTSLKKVTFRKGSSKLKSIGYTAFRGNENLKTINIPFGVVIEERAFEDAGCSEDIFTPGATIVDCTVETKGLRGN